MNRRNRDIEPKKTYNQKQVKAVEKQIQQMQEFLQEATDGLNLCQNQLHLEEWSDWWRPNFDRQCILLKLIPIAAVNRLRKEMEQIYCKKRSEIIADDESTEALNRTLWLVEYGRFNFFYDFEPEREQIIEGIARFISEQEAEQCLLFGTDFKIQPPVE